MRFDTRILGPLALAAVALTLQGALAAAPAAALPDSRGWELVSPPDKNGVGLDQPETILGGGAFQAAAQGSAITYTSSASFADPLGSPGASQYLARRSGSGWANQNLTVAALSGSYDSSPGAGTPYRLFSSDLAAAVLTNGQRCRAESGQCPVANPPLAGSGAPPGYRNYYLRNDDAGSFTALLGSADFAHSTLTSSQLELEFVAATPDLSQIVLSSCAKLTANATEVAGSGGECDPAAQNLYLRSGTGALRLINLLPGDTQGTPGAQIAAQGGAISGDGARVYFTAEPSPGTRNLYLREGTQTKQVDGAAEVGGGGSLQTASADGSIAFFTKAGFLYRYLAATEATTKLTAAGEVLGVLGASPDGTYLYYLAADGLHQWHLGADAKIAAAADASNYPPASGTARVSVDGSVLAFLSAAKLTGFDPKGVTEVYRYSGSGLACVSCNQTATKPLGPAMIPGAYANGTALEAYKPRALSDSGNRLFFTTKDALVAADTNGDPDVYQWEANGTGSCAKAAGCVDLISSGKAEGGGRFIDASADGSDAFFTTDGSLAFNDPGFLDLYDARVGGGFPPPPISIPCVGDDCQSLPGEPDDPTPGTLLQAAGNEPLHFPPAKQQKKHKKKHHKKSAKVKKHGGRAK